jgi:hypothetical protein
MKALQLHAGPRARVQLRERGLQPADVRVIPAAAGGPKGLVLNPLDRFIFGHWLTAAPQTVHLIGASIGAWRMASACLSDTDAAFAQLADDYIAQDYPREPGKAPKSCDVSRIFGATLDARFSARAAEVLSHPRYRLHVVTSRGRHILRREGKVATPLGYLGAFATNLVNRRAVGGWLERVVFSDPREPLPFALHDFRSKQVPLTEANIAPGLLASCSIPFWLDAVHDIAGAPRGAYWDGGITDYHLHLDYAAMRDGLVLYPHFQTTVVPGWFDKSLKRRHGASERLSNVVLLVPNPEWVKAVMPGGKIPDRGDFKAYGERIADRQRDWKTAVVRSQQMADEFAELTQQASIEALPLD